MDLGLGDFGEVLAEIGETGLTTRLDVVVKYVNSVARTTINLFVLDLLLRLSILIRIEGMKCFLLLES